MPHSSQAAQVMSHSSQPLAGKSPLGWGRGTAAPTAGDVCGINPRDPRLGHSQEGLPQFAICGGHRARLGGTGHVFSQPFLQMGFFVVFLPISPALHTLPVPTPGWHGRESTLQVVPHLGPWHLASGHTQAFTTILCFLFPLSPFNSWNRSSPALCR